MVHMYLKSASGSDAYAGIGLSRIFNVAPVSGTTFGWTLAVARYVLGLFFPRLSASGQGRVAQRKFVLAILRETSSRGRMDPQSIAPASGCRNKSLTHRVISLYCQYSVRWEYCAVSTIFRMPPPWSAVTRTKLYCLATLTIHRSFSWIPSSFPEVRSLRFSTYLVVTLFL